MGEFNKAMLREAETKLALATDGAIVHIGRLFDRNQEIVDIAQIKQLADDLNRIVETLDSLQSSVKYYADKLAEGDGDEQ